jgi:hypothetical protein
MAATPKDIVKEASKQTGNKIQWDTGKMRTSYANVAHASSTREEFTFLFGTNQSWNIGQDHELKVELSDRIILSPFVAKRLHQLLGGVLKEYESRFGALDPTLVGGDESKKS